MLLRIIGTPGLEKESTTCKRHMTSILSAKRSKKLYK